MSRMRSAMRDTNLLGFNADLGVDLRNEFGKKVGLAMNGITGWSAGLRLFFVRLDERLVLGALRRCRGRRLAAFRHVCRGW